MNAYDKIGQLERRQGNDFEALQAFERALVIANRLGLDEAYFVEQIESVASDEVPDEPSESESSAGEPSESAVE